ncbi:MAG: hypothetical protein ACYTF6_11005 [Planctomycetota bacterium]|jgi:hypothetical protein
MVDGLSQIKGKSVDILAVFRTSDKGSLALGLPRIKGEVQLHFVGYLDKATGKPHIAAMLEFGETEYGPPLGALAVVCATRPVKLGHEGVRLSVAIPKTEAVTFPSQGWIDLAVVQTNGWVRFTKFLSNVLTLPNQSVDK